MDKSWHSILGLREWYCLHTDDKQVVLRFRLYTYSIVDGAVKLTFQTDSGTEFVGGMDNVVLLYGLKIRIYRPIDMRKVSPQGYSPKCVLTMPRKYSVSESDKLPPAVITYDRVRLHTPLQARA